MSPKTVFLSYRRGYSGWAARSVYQALKSRGVDVFMDVEAIDAGRFETVVLNEIASRDHFLVLLDSRTCQDLALEGDWVRRELERALELEKNVVPFFT